MYEQISPEYNFRDFKTNHHFYGNTIERQLNPTNEIKHTPQK